MNREPLIAFFVCLLTAVFLTLPLLLLAGGPGPPPPPGGVPLDPLSWVLLAGAGGMAAKKIYGKKTPKSSDAE